MGCQTSKNKETQSESNLTSRLLKNINTHNFEELTILAGHPEVAKIINSTIVTIKGNHLNLLGYALWNGNVESFKFIHEHLKADISSMEALLMINDISAFHIIFSKGYLSLLEYMLPHYLDEVKEYPVMDIDGKDSLFWKPEHGEAYYMHNLMPLQIATVMNNIQIISFVYEYFKEKSFVPRLLDLEYENEKNGENCVLVACRFRSYLMIKYFHEICKLNFRVKNRQKRNVINVLLEGSQSKNDDETLVCLMYLVETVHVDVDYNYKFNLRITKNREVLKYIIFKLQEIGVVESCNNAGTNITYSEESFIEGRDTTSNLDFLRYREPDTSTFDITSG